MATEQPARWERPVFIASMGRSGSTLLQRVLNVHPEVTIWGEHGGFLTGILQSYRTASDPATRDNLVDGYEFRDTVIGELSDKGVFKPWVSPFTPADLGEAARTMMFDLFTQGLTEDMRWGFKEIRYTDAEFRTLMEMFPQAHLVILARDFVGYAQSRFFAFGNTNFDLDTDEGMAKAKNRLESMIGGWTRRYQGLLALRSDLGDRASVVAYSDLVPGSPRIDTLFEELGEKPPRPGAIEEVLGAVSGSSYKHNSKARSSRDKLGELIESADVDREEIARLSRLLGLS